MAPKRRRAGDPPPQYGPLEERFTVEINHGGLFCGSGINKTYIDSRTEYFDDCDVESWSPLWLVDFLQQLGYVPENVQVYWMLPGKRFNDGLRIIESDSDTLMMNAVVPKFQYFKLYVNQKGLFDGINIDDICIDGSPELPTVVSPKPAPNYGFRGSEQSVADDIGDSDDSDSNFGDDIVDSDNELDKDDDDLFEEWADEDVVPKKKTGIEMDEDYDTDELGLPESDSDYEQEDNEETEEQQAEEQQEDNNNKKKKKKKKVKVRPFRPEDMQAPSFGLGMSFPTVGHLRNAIQEYMIQNRRKISYVKNDLQRVRVRCEEGCAWYLYANLENLKNKLWAIARSYNMLTWRKNMDEMKALNQEAYEYLEEIDPKSWCRAFFKELPKSDLLLNNTCEVFNKYILDARELPMRSMLDKIKNQVMTRIYGKNVESDEWCGIICPKIRKKLDKQVEMSNNCFAKPALKGIFQVTSKTGPYTVDLNKNVCECGSWQLTGIPCRHAISCFRHEGIKPENKVCKSYSISAYKAAYAHGIMPCRDQKAWPKTNGVLVKPPVYEKHVGRPSKKRRKSALESEDGFKMSKHGSISHCSLCNSTEHNKRRCPNKGMQGEAIPEAAPGGHKPPRGQKKKLAVRRNIMVDTQESGAIIEDAMALTVQQALFYEAEASQQSQVLPGPLPLPESQFIARQRDALTSSNVQLKPKKKRATKPKK